jgi:hypothetical protein
MPFLGLKSLELWGFKVAAQELFLRTSCFEVALCVVCMLTLAGLPCSGLGIARGKIDRFPHLHQTTFEKIFLKIRTKAVTSIPQHIRKIYEVAYDGTDYLSEGNPRQVAASN